MPEVKTATCRAEFKALPSGDGGADTGIVEALVSVFGNVDEIGDRVIPGAFTDCLAEWAAKGDPIPFIWAHKWSDPMAHIGYVLEAKEVTEGLWVKAQLDLDRPVAEQVWHLLKQRRVTQFSFGYDVEEYAWVSDPTARWGEVRELRKLSMFECGPCLLGMNPDTQLIGASARPDPDGHPARAAEKATGDPVEPGSPGSRDDAATIPVERIRALMALTRHTEE